MGAARRGPLTPDIATCARHAILVRRSHRAAGRAVWPTSRPWVYRNRMTADQVEGTAAAMYRRRRHRSRRHVQALVQGESRRAATHARHAIYDRPPSPSQAECRRFEPVHPLFSKPFRSPRVPPLPSASQRDPGCQRGFGRNAHGSNAERRTRDGCGVRDFDQDQTRPNRTSIARPARRKQGRKLVLLFSHWSFLF